MRPTTTWRREEGVNGCVREGRRGLWGAAMRRRRRPSISLPPPRAAHHELVDVHGRVHRDLAAKVVLELLVLAAGGGVVAQQLGEGLGRERERERERARAIEKTMRAAARWESRRPRSPGPQCRVRHHRGAHLDAHGGPGVWGLGAWGEWRRERSGGTHTDTHRRARARAEKKTSVARLDSAGFAAVSFLDFLTPAHHADPRPPLPPVVAHPDQANGHQPAYPLPGLH